MIQEDVENRSVQLAVKTGKVTAMELMRALRAYLRHHQNKKHAMETVKDDIVRGEQSVKELIGQNQGVSSMPVGDYGIRDFRMIANRYGVDFAIVENEAVDLPKYTVFFKARDVDAITAIVKEYGQVLADKEKCPEKERPSVLAELKRCKEKVALLGRKDREKIKERAL